MSITGLLSNNYTNETLSLRSAPPVGGLKIKATRISTGEVIWNSDWLGQDVATSYPPIPPSGSLRRGFATAAHGAGVSIIGGNVGPGVGLPGTSFINAPDSFTAQAAGGSLGGWQDTGALLPGSAPNPVLSGSGAAVFVPALISPVTSAASCVVTLPSGATWVYLIGGIDEYGNLTDGVWRCQMNSDGSLSGAWIFEGHFLVPICSASACMFWAGSVNPQQFLMVSGGLTSASTPAGGLQPGTPTNAVHVSGINGDGSLAASLIGWPTDAAMVNAKYGHSSLAFNGCLFTFGGYQNSGGASAGFQPCEKSVITQTTNGGTPGAWATTVALATPVAFHSMIVLGIPGTPTVCDIFLLGGVAAGGDSAVVQVASITATTLSSWTATSRPLPAADSQGGAFANVDELGNVTMYYITGNSGANAVYSTTEAIVSGSIALGAWQTGPASPPLQTSDMGTGGSVVTNADGSQTLTFQFNGPGNDAVDNPNAGDVILFQAQVVDAVLGALSPVSTIGALVFGDPPTIGSIAITPNAGNPTVTFAFLPGNGSQGQKSWRVVISDAGGTVYADSGVQMGQVNSYTPVCNPPLVSLTAYTVTITVTSLDLPYIGSSNSESIGTTYTPTLTPPATPSAVTAAPDPTTGGVDFGWTNAANTVANRIWMRLHGATAWTLLKNVTAAAGAQTLSLFDQIGLNTSYDYCITAINAAGAESVQGGNTVSQVVILPGSPTSKDPTNAGGGYYSLMLHFAGLGATNRIQLVENPAGTFTITPTTKLVPVFGVQNPLVRYGVGQPVLYDVTEVFVPNQQAQIALETFLDLAQNIGSPIYARDLLGNVLVVAVTERTYSWVPSGTPTAGQPTQFIQKATLKLSSIQFTYAP